MRRRASIHGRRASVAIEVALITPIYVITTFGLVDVGRFFIWLDQARRCAIIAANSVSEETVIGKADSTNASGGTVPGLNTILAQVAAAAPAGNWSTTNGIIVTALVTNASGYPTSELQAKYPTTLAATSPYTCGSSFAPPVAFTDPNDTVIIGEIIYSFTPFTFLGSFDGLTQMLTVHDYSFYRVRQPTTLTSASSC